MVTLFVPACEVTGQTSRPPGTSETSSMRGASDAVTERLYILADGWDPSPFRYFAARCESQPGWRVVKMACGHDVMVDQPLQLAQELLRLA